MEKLHDEITRSNHHCTRDDKYIFQHNNMKHESSHPLEKIQTNPDESNHSLGHWSCSGTSVFDPGE